MSIDDQLLRLAEQRNHLLRLDELRQLGRTRGQIRSELARGRLHRVYPGVVSLVSPPWDPATQAVAVCLSIPEAVISFSTAAALHGIRRAPRAWLDVTVPRGRSVRLADVHVHRTNHLPPEDVVCRIDGLRLTTPARTLFDLASVLDGPALRSAVEDARNRQLVTDLELDDVGQRLVRQGRGGSSMFRSVVDPLLGETPVQSHAEGVVRDALVAAGLDPVPQHPFRLPNGRQVFFDLALLDSRLDIEIDPMFTHGSRAAVGSDKARDVQVVLAGWQPARFTDDDVELRLRNIVGYVAALDRQRRCA